MKGVNFMELWNNIIGKKKQLMNLKEEKKY